MTITRDPKRSFLSSYPYHGNVWIYYPPKWWHIRVRGGEWVIHFYPNLSSNKMGRAIVKFEELVLSGGLDNLLLTSDLGTIRQYVTGQRAHIVYRLQFKTQTDALLFKLAMHDDFSD